MVRGVLGQLPESVAESASFELRSKLGRSRARRLAIPADEKVYINLGSGGDSFSGFIGIDFFGDPTAYGADLRYPLLIDDDTVDGIFTEHTLEHLTYDEDARLLQECFRILKPGGRIRVVLPDVSLFAKHYAAGDTAWFAQWEQLVLAPRGRKLVSPMTAISFVTQEFGHRSAWDMTTVERFLTAAGFTDVIACRYGSGTDPMLVKDNSSPDRTFLSLYAEAVKPAR